MEKALQKAIEAGWKPTRWKPNGVESDTPLVVTEEWIKAFCLLDPKFWQALGKAEGWDKKVGENCCHVCGEPMPPGETMFKFHGYSSDCPKPPLRTKEWKKVRADLLEHIDNGKDIDSFFKELLKVES